MLISPCLNLACASPHTFFSKWHIMRLIGTTAKWSRMRLLLMANLRSNFTPHRDPARRAATDGDVKLHVNVNLVWASKIKAPDIN